METRQSRIARNQSKTHRITCWLAAAFFIIGICSLSAYLLLNGVFKGASTAAGAKTTATNIESLSSQLAVTNMKTSIAEEDSSQLVTGKNHNKQAQAYAYQASEVRQAIYSPETYTGDKVCFLTFDDGVNDETTPKILDTLKRYQVHATFFVVGKTLGEGTQSLLEREIKEGHAIGIHSYSHDYQLLYPNGTANSEQIGKEVQQTQQLLQSLLGKDFKSTVWRYPGGHMSWKGTKAVDSELKQSAIEWMDWNAMVGDAEPLTTRPSTVEEMLAFHKRTLAINPDSLVRVVLMHDTVDKKLTAEALPYIIEYYQSQGYKFGVLT